MITRRSLLASLGVVGAGVLAPTLVGSAPTTRKAAMDISLASSDLPRVTGSDAAGAESARAVAAFTSDLYARISALPGNVVCSPWSVASALAMTRAGARGRTAEEITRVLRAGPSYDEGLSLLDHELAGRDEVSLETASSLWGQAGIRWERPFLDHLAEDFGTGMHMVDYVAETEQARRAINAWTSEHTGHRIEELLAPGVLDPTSRLTLVNAIWFKAGWLHPFPTSGTQDRTFTRRDSTTTEVPTMAARVPHAGFASGASWRAARLPFAGGELAMAVVVPDDGHTVTDVERALVGDGLHALLTGFEVVDLVDVRLPSWTTRTSAELSPQLGAMGMRTAFTDDADFSAMTGDQPLKVDAVVHQAWVAVDEDGAEAAAATAVVMMRAGAVAPTREPRVEQVHADRPYVYVIHDVATATPLFVGRVDDPST